MIEVQNLTKRYGELQAVKDLSFKVEKGKIWGLLGPNAAGKTTTMRILTGYLPATEGKAVVAGHDVFERPNEVKKIIGYLPEQVPLYPEMTVTDFLHFVAEIKQIPGEKRKESVDRVIQDTGLGGVAKRLIKNISRGYKQRVGIAQALIHDPQVLILDEPTIGLDPAQIKEVRELIKRLREEHTILLSTHLLAEVTQTCDGVVIINEGKLMAAGSLEDLTASFRREEGVVLKLRKRGNDVAGAFREIPGIKTVSVEGDELRIEWKPGEDPRDDITRLAVENDLGLQEMRPLGTNLEDLYLKIVSGGPEQ